MAFSVYCIALLLLGLTLTLLSALLYMISHTLTYRCTVPTASQSSSTFLRCRVTCQRLHRMFHLHRHLFGINDGTAVRSYMYCMQLYPAYRILYSCIEFGGTFNLLANS